MEESTEHAWTKCSPEVTAYQSDRSSALSPIQAFVTTTAGRSDGSDSSQGEFKDLRSASQLDIHRRGGTEGSVLPNPSSECAAGEMLSQRQHELHSQQQQVVNPKASAGSISPPSAKAQAPSSPTPVTDAGRRSATQPSSVKSNPTQANPVKSKSIPSTHVRSNLRRSLTPDSVRHPQHRRKGSLDSLLLPANFTKDQADLTMHRRKSNLKPSLHPSLNPPSNPSNTANPPRLGHLVRSGSLGLVRPGIDFWKLDSGPRPLVGSVKMHERMVFLCYKDPATWPPRIEAAEADRLPKMLASAIYMKRKVLPKKTKFALCEGAVDSECDVLIFPDMKRYCAVTHFDIDFLIDEALLGGSEKVMSSQPLTGCHVFVCAHASRDARCGSCGPPLVTAFRAVLHSKGLEDSVHVRACSHIGGHAFAGNVIIYMEKGGKVVGDWYGYVTPRDVPLIVEHHIEGGNIVDKLWRGAMGLTPEQQQRELQRIRTLQDVEAPEPDSAPCANCTFLDVEEIEDLVSSGVCAPHDPSLLEEVALKRSCCDPTALGAQSPDSPPNEKAFSWGSAGSSIFASMTKQVKRLHDPEWWRKFDTTDVALCGALALSGVALCIAIDWHRRSR